MNLPRRLLRDESGQVLYMTVFLMMLLTAFALVLANVIYLACMKIKAQNAADNLALSVAARQAQVLNQLIVVNRKAEIQGMPPADAEQQANNEIFDYNQQASPAVNPNFIDTIAACNGLQEASSKWGLWPNPEINGTAKAAKTNQTLTQYNASGIPSFGPKEAWYIQSRVELQVKAALIGGARLGVRLPDLAARARAEIYDRSPEPRVVKGRPISAACTHAWDVRLAKPTFEDDQTIISTMNE